MTSDQSPPPKGKRDLSPRRTFLLALYIFVLVILVKLYWPGWPLPDRTNPPAAPAAPATGPQIPQN